MEESKDKSIETIIFKTIFIMTMVNSTPPTIVTFIYYFKMIGGSKNDAH